MLITMFLSLFTFFIYMFNTPISCILLLIIITTLISLMTLHSTHSSWLPLIILLMLIGGMLIMFIYMAAISPNKKYRQMTKTKTIKLLFLIFIITTLLPVDMTISTNSPITTFSMVNNPPFMIFSITYLFMFLLMLTLILHKNKAPLRSM